MKTRMSVENNPKMSLRLVDYSGENIGLIHWHQDGKISADAVDLKEQTNLGELLDKLNTTKLPLYFCVLETKGELRSATRFAQWVDVKNERFLEALQDNLHKYSMGERRLVGILESPEILLMNLR